VLSSWWRRSVERRERERERDRERERGETIRSSFVILLNFVTDHSFSIFEHSSKLA